MEYYYLWLDVVLKVVDDISRGTIAGNHNDLPFRALELCHSHFFGLLPHNLSEMSCATFEPWIPKIVSFCKQEQEFNKKQLRRGIDHCSGRQICILLKFHFDHQMNCVFVPPLFFFSLLLLLLIFILLT